MTCVDGRRRHFFTVYGHKGVRYQPIHTIVRHNLGGYTMTNPRTEAAEFAVIGEWFCGHVDGCTCAGGTLESSYAHEQGCGWEPLAKVDEVRSVLAAADRAAGVVRVNTRSDGDREALRGDARDFLADLGGTE